MSEYLQLYKKHRPQTWDDVVGQDTLVASLRRSVVEGTVPSPLGLFGPHGTGKTTIALLLAKAINCENTDDTGNPCNQCDTCVAIDNREQPGVELMSMANDGGVDNIREVVNRASLKQPVKRNVIILDEAHNLSKPAQESLLVPLGEKGLDALFILCSTEIQKMTKTILSRTQQRKLNRVSASQMTQLLRHIVEVENLDVDDDAIESAVRQGGGSVRDSITQLESIISTGVTETGYGTQLLTAIGSHDIATALTVIAQASHENIECHDLMEQLFEDMRNILLTAYNVDASLIGAVPLSDIRVFTKGAGSPQNIVTCLKIVENALSKSAMGQSSRIQLEMAVVQIITMLSAAKK